MIIKDKSKVEIVPNYFTDYTNKASQRLNSIYYSINSVENLPALLK